MICSCHVVSERRIQRAIDHGACSIADVAAVCGAGGTCHGCHDAIDQLIETSAVRRCGRPRSRRLTPTLSSGVMRVHRT
jgi:bacterioferritin-associated ferredoxin